MPTAVAPGMYMYDIFQMVSEHNKGLSPKSEASFFQICPL